MIPLSHTDFSVDALVAAKGDQRISVVIPARDEESSVAAVVARVIADCVQAVPLVDEVVVIDSDSVDATAARARSAGAIVHAARDIRPDLGRTEGKGEALWKSQFVTSGDLLVFLDSDLVDWGTHFVSGLLGPLLADPRVQLVKAVYDRPLLTPDGHEAERRGLCWPCTGRRSRGWSSPCRVNGRSGARHSPRMPCRSVMALRSRPSWTPT